MTVEIAQGTPLDVTYTGTGWDVAARVFWEVRFTPEYLQSAPGLPKYELRATALNGVTIAMVVNHTEQVKHVLRLPQVSNRYGASADVLLRVAVTELWETAHISVPYAARFTTFKILAYVVEPTAVVHSRRQRIFGAEEVLWSEGAAPAAINGNGHDDFAWRLGAGLGEGVVLGGTHRLAEDYRVRRRGEFVQVRVKGERGFSGLRGVRVDEQIGRRGKGDRA